VVIRKKSVSHPCKKYMKLIIGLGNPGEQYQETRHNIGFKIIGKFSQQIDGQFKLSKKLLAETCLTKFGDQKIILAKSQTFMNNSGQAVKAIMSYFKIEPADLWVIYDDIDLPVGKLRIGKFKSSAGHNGIQSIIDHLNSTNFIRFRIGIKPLVDHKKPAIDLVLNQFSASEKILIDDITNKCVEALKDNFKLPLEKIMSKYN
jgi:peptidyl-tRNA hydrolase, PTH1 family